MGAPGTTPGPWKLLGQEVGFDGIPYIEVSAGECGTKSFKSVACVQPEFDGVNDWMITDRNRADAYQIIASSDVYDALDELENALLDGLCNYGLPDFDTNRVERARTQARAALAKARGESC